MLVGFVWEILSNFCENLCSFYSSLRSSRFIEVSENYEQPLKSYRDSEVLFLVELTNWLILSYAIEFTKFDQNKVSRSHIVKIFYWKIFYHMLLFPLNVNPRLIRIIWSIKCLCMWNVFDPQKYFFKLQSWTIIWFL